MDMFNTAIYDVKRYTGFRDCSFNFQVKLRAHGNAGPSYTFKRIFFYSWKDYSSALREFKVYRRLLAANIQCPLIATLYHSFIIHDTPVLIMSYLGVKKLSDINHLINKEEDAKFYIAEIMCALEVLHKLQIVHLDLKPANVCIQNSGHILLADFYRSADLSTEREVTHMGDLSFVAPEVKNRNQVSIKADIFSLACLTCNVVSNFPRAKTNIRKKLEQASRGQIWIWNFSRLSSGLQQFFRACSSFNPDDRPTIGELKGYQFFDGLNWNNVYNCGLRPPVLPSEFCQSSEYHPLILEAAYGEKRPTHKEHLTIKTEPNGNQKPETETVRRNAPADYRFLMNELFSKYEYLSPEFARCLLVQSITMNTV